jgi:hypothetical protein
MEGNSQSLGGMVQDAGMKSGRILRLAKNIQRIHRGATPKGPTDSKLSPPIERTTANDLRTLNLNLSEALSILDSIESDIAPGPTPEGQAGLGETEAKVTDRPANATGRF